MEIEQFIKKLNNTELGKAHTNERYARIPNSLKFLDEWRKDTKNGYLNFIDRQTKQAVSINCSIGRERRLVSTVEYFEKVKKFNAGDNIIFERRKYLGKEPEYFIDSEISNDKVLFLKKGKRGENKFIIMNIDRLFSFKDSNGNYEIPVVFKSLKKTILIQSIGSGTIRDDSPDDSDQFKVSIEGGDFKNLKGNKDYLELDVINGINVLSVAVMHQFYKFQLTDSKIAEEVNNKKKEEIKKLIEQTVKNNGYVVGSSVKGAVTFLTKNINNIIPKTSDANWLQKESFAYEIVYRKGFIQLKFVITPGNEHNRNILREIAKNIPGGRKAKGEKWIVNYINTIKTDIYDYSIVQGGNIKKLIDKILNENKTQIEFFENEVLNQKDKFQY